jgi:hypothetical protein
VSWLPLSGAPGTRAGQARHMTCCRRTGSSGGGDERARALHEGPSATTSAARPPTGPAAHRPGRASDRPASRRHVRQTRSGHDRPPSGSHPCCASSVRSAAARASATRIASTAPGSGRRAVRAPPSVEVGRGRSRSVEQDEAKRAALPLSQRRSRTPIRYITSTYCSGAAPPWAGATRRPCRRSPAGPRESPGSTATSVAPRPDGRSSRSRWRLGDHGRGPGSTDLQPGDRHRHDPAGAGACHGDHPIDRWFRPRRCTGRRIEQFQLSCRVLLCHVCGGSARWQVGVTPRG